MGDLLRRGQGHQLTTALQSVRHIRIVWGQGRVVAGDEAFLQAQDDAPLGTVRFSAYAVPKTYAEGMTAEFTLDNGAGGVTTVPGSFRPSTQTFYTDSIACALTDDITLSVAFRSPDGTRQNVGGP